MKVKLFLLILFLFFLDSYAQFGNQRIISLEGSVTNVYASDLDGDGDMDVISTYTSQVGDAKVTWHENIDGLGNFGPQQILYQDPFDAIWLLHAGDLDGDNDIDIISAASGINKIAWFENLDGLGDFSSIQSINNEVSIPNGLYVIDLDGDSDIDILSNSRNNNNIVWFENLNGQGIFGSQQIISTNVDWPIGVHANDLDGDGDIDVLSASYEDDKIAWYENLDGQGDFGTQQIITTMTDGAGKVFSCDIDGDGDIDVLSTSSFDNKIAWYENLDGLGNFGSQQIISTNVDRPRDVFAIDLDGDGDRDVLSASGFDDKIAWYENLDGLGNFGTQQIITTLANGANSVYATDLDGDGDQDVLSTSQLDGKIAWYENLTPLSVDDKVFFDLSINPVPTSDFINIKTQSSITQIEIYNILGKLVYSKLNQNRIDISNLEKGIYLIKIENEDGYFVFKKIVKK